MFLWTREPMESVIPSCDPRPIARRIPGGFVEGYDTPEGFCVSRLVSTDLKNKRARPPTYSSAKRGYIK